MKRFLKLFACVLALSLLVAFFVNASNIAKPLTHKKVVNPENVLNDDTINYVPYVAKEGITYERNKDGSWHIYGTTTVANTGVFLTFDTFTLESGKTYSFSSGMKHDSLKSYFLRLAGSNGKIYYGNLDPTYATHSANEIFGSFVAESGVTYHLQMVFVYAGATIDEVVYPCLVEGTEPGDFYIYK